MKRRKKQEEHVNHERWLVSYADFITLLFAFFTVMYATSEQDTNKGKKFEQSVQKYLKLGAMGDSGHRVNTGQTQNSAIDSPVKKSRSGGAVKIQKKVESLIEKTMTVEEMNKSIKDISAEYAGVRVSLSSDSLFKKGSTQISPQSKRVMNKMGKVLSSTKRNVYILGHTDDSRRFPSGVASHWELGSLQASKIVRYFIQVHGVPANKIAALSYGKSRPIGDNKNELGRSKNRRIDILILDEGLPL